MGVTEGESQEEDSLRRNHDVTTTVTRGRRSRRGCGGQCSGGWGESLGDGESLTAGTQVLLGDGGTSAGCREGN